MTLVTYLPQDRRRALAQGIALPRRTTGSVLFADISGFTPFTETLRHAFGPRQGTEKLSDLLSAVYTALIAEVERYGGSVTGFAGDAITCWFDATDGSAPPRAVACAVALQRAMRPFREIPLSEEQTGQLMIKVAVATGAVQRLVVGDEAHYWLDVLVGQTVRRTAVGESLANAPEILLDTATAAALGDTLPLLGWRTDPETGTRFAVMDAENFTAVIPPSPPAPLPTLDETTLAHWLNPLVYHKEQTEHAVLRTEFRPCVALFVRFTGIDYEADTAEGHLNQFVSHLLHLADRYESTLIDLTFGDKGSYLYLNFGALSAHEDDARRAVKTALELQEMAALLDFLAPLQIGLTYGVMRTGAYGSPTRRHYGALGDEVNLAARLMGAAQPGEILVSGRIYQMVREQFWGEKRPPLALKGKANPVSTYRLTAVRHQTLPRLYLHEPTYTMPMVGRRAELATIVDKLTLVEQGQAQIVSLVGEAGLGKSRLATEAMKAAHGRGFQSYGGACQSDGPNTSYLVWKPILATFFGLTADQSPTQQIDHLTQAITQRAPHRLNTLPLLARLLDLPLADNAFTHTLEPKYRQTALHALLEDCLKQASRDAPLLLFIDDLHWIDALSHDLLDALAKALAVYPIFFLLVYRPTKLARLQAPRLEARPYFTPLILQELTEAEATQIIHHKLNQLYPVRGRDIPPAQVHELMSRTQGNPFYLEELLNYLHDRHLDPRHSISWETLDLPDSLHALILSRIDQLQDSEKRTLRVASIIGRLFPVKWLIGYYPQLGALPQVQADLRELQALDFTLLDSAEPELSYLFKHIITHEVTYENMPFATRAQLHEQLAVYLEQIDAPLENTAHHYGQSYNATKKIYYWQKAAEASQANYANETALDYYEKLLAILSSPQEISQVYSQYGAVLERVGQFAEAEAAYRQGLALAEEVADSKTTAVIQFALGKLGRVSSQYEMALTWLAQAESTYTTLGDQRGLVQIAAETGRVLHLQGLYAQARDRMSEALPMAHQNSDKPGLAQLYNNLSVTAFAQADMLTAQEHGQKAFALRQELEDKWGMAASLNNLGIIPWLQGDLAAAQELFAASLTLKRQMGDKLGMANSLHNLGTVAYEQHDYPVAGQFFEETLALRREIEDKVGLTHTLHNLGLLACDRGQLSLARERHREGLALAQAIGAKTSIALELFGLGRVAMVEAVANPTPDRIAEADRLLRESLQLRYESGLFLSAASNLIVLARLAVVLGQFIRAVQWLSTAVAILDTKQAKMREEVLAIYEQTIALTQAELDTPTFEMAWETGQQMSIADVLAQPLEIL